MMAKKKFSSSNVRSLLKNKWVLFGAAIGLAGIITISILTFAGSCTFTNSKGCPTVRKGSRGEAVRVLQRRLIAQCYYTDAKNNKLAVDGVFGTDTLKAVKEFQTNNKGYGINQVTGIVGPQTWGMLAEPTKKNKNCTAIFQ
jgi:hypothetical protein